MVAGALKAWRDGLLAAVVVALAAAVIPALPGCARGCTRVVSLAAQRAAIDYVMPSLRVYTPPQLRETHFGPSLRRLRAAAGKAGVNWQVLAPVDLNLALAGLVAQRRDAADDALLEQLIAHGVEPFIPDPLGRVPFALAVFADHAALKLLLPHIARARGRPPDQILCGLHQVGGPNAYRTLRGYCRCRD